MRVVVTGLGMISPVGIGAEAAWSNLLKGKSGISRLGADVAPDVPAQVAGVVMDFNADAFIPSKDQKKMDRFIQFALAAADEALKQSGWQPQNEQQKMRTATVIASGIGGFHSIVEAVEITAERGIKRLSPFTVPSFLCNLAAGWISIRHGFKGPIGAPVTACAAGVQAIGDAARLIRAGEVDVAIAGGAEAAIHRVSLGGFAAARALSSGFNDTPERASRPFDVARDGFVMGEGAGVVVLESLEHAQARGAKIIAELVGYGTSADAHHLTASPEDGSGAQQAMRTALAQAGISPDAIGHLNAHATSTPVGDKAELAAVRAVFDDKSPAISATKSSTGHLLGAAGGIEAIFTILALRDGLLPPTLNFESPDELAAGLDIVHGSARKAEIEYALSNGFGFGGVNASVLFRRWTH